MTLTDKAEALLPCPFCGGGITSIEGKGQIWRGVNGYSAPQWYQLNHYGKLSETDDFQRCNVEFRCRTEAEAIAAWNRRAALEPAPTAAEAREAAIRECAAALRKVIDYAAFAGANPDEVEDEAINSYADYLLTLIGETRA